MKKKNKIAIIVPAYNEEDNLRIFFKETNEIIQNLEDYTWEFIFIDDGSNELTAVPPDLGCDESKWWVSRTGHR